jgi:hypothetical protein
MVTLSAMSLGPAFTFAFTLGMSGQTGKQQRCNSDHQCQAARQSVAGSFSEEHFDVPFLRCPAWSGDGLCHFDDLSPLLRGNLESGLTCIES